MTKPFFRTGGLVGSREAAVIAIFTFSAAYIGEFKFFQVNDIYNKFSVAFC